MTATTSTTADLVLDHVTMMRRGLTLVTDLSLTVRPGQTLAGGREDEDGDHGHFGVASSLSSSVFGELAHGDVEGGEAVGGGDLIFF